MNITYHTYKFRTECYADFNTACECWWMADVNVVKETQQTIDLGGGVLIPLPDYEFVIKTPASIEWLITLLSNKPKADLHVIYQTLDKEENYTGVRKRDY